MKQYILHILIILAALLVADSAWGQTARGTLPDPNELNEDLSTGIYTLTKNYKPGSQKRWRVSNGRNVIVDLNGYTIDGVNIDRTIFNISSGTLTIIDSKGGGTIKNSTKSCFYVAPSSGAKSTLNLQGGTILNCQPSDGNGGAMDIQPNGTVNMSGGTITGCKGTSGAAVYVIGGTFNMTGGTITNNKVNAYKDWTPPTGTETLPTSNNTSTTRGGGIYVEKGKCTVSGGTISGNVAHSGGGVFVTSGATFSFTGGTIEGNYAVAKLGQGTGNGGGIYIEGGNSNCTINGGTIRNNRATRYGGGININGSTITIPNCIISGNLASSGGGISMESSGSTLNLQGCTLNGNLAKISGSDPQGANGGGGAIFVVNGTINMSGTNNIQNNRSRVLGGGIFVKAGNIKATGISTFTGNEATNTDGVDSHGGAIYLAGGNITVDANGTLNIGASSSSTGNKAKNNGGGIYCKGTITINGSSTMKYNTANNGGAVFVTGGNVTLTGNTISNNSATNYGGALYVSEGNLVMNGTSTMNANTATLRGGAAYVNKGQISTAQGSIQTNISSNSVIGNDSSTKASGGAFYIEGESSSKGQLNLRGITTMSGNSTKDNGGAVTLKNGNLIITGSSTTFLGNHAENGGAVYVNSGDIKTNNTSTVTNLENNYCINNGGAIYVTSGNFTTQGSISIVNNYASNNGGAVYVTGGQVSMATPTITGNGKKSGIAETENGGAVYVTGEGAGFTATGTAKFNSNAAKTNGGAVFVEGGSLSMVANEVNSNSAESGGAFYVTNGTVSMTGKSDIKGNSATSNGGAFFVSGGTIILSANSITENKATGGSGGAVYLTNGSVKAGASTIENNYATGNGGAFYVENGNVEVTSATISGNGKNGSAATTDNGGAIYVKGTDAGFTATGDASILSNAAENEGGAIYVNGGNITLAKNTISNNSAATGGALYVEGGGFSAAGTTEMASNSASGDGGAIYVNGGNIEITGQSSTLNLSGNNASNGGVFYVNGGSITANEILKATISNNYSNAEGGAFYVTGGNIQLCDTELSGNGRSGAEVKTTNGGAIALHNGVFSFGSNSEIKNNAANNLGGALYVANADKTSISCSGGSYINNTASLGGGIYASGPITLTFAANVRDNIAKNGGGLYLDGGVDMSFGNGLIVGNRAEVEQSAARDASQYGVGGGIYLNKGTLSFTEAQNLGIYNNAASYEAADIYASGIATTINLPNVKGMNLTGFDVPGSELYWVNDYAEQRYEDALRDRTINIEEMILGFEDKESVKILENLNTCLDLGYDLVFVTLSSIGLDAFDSAGLSISYDKDGTPTEYRQIILLGEESKRVGLPSGDWKFDVTSWAKKYKFPEIAPGPSANGYINIKREKNVILNDIITFKFEKVDEAANVTTYDYRKVNKMIPGGSN